MAKDIIDKINELLPRSEYRDILKSSSADLNYLFTLIEKRFNDLEDKVYKRTVETTRAQQMLLLHHSGMLEALEKSEIKTKKEKARLLSALLNRNKDNIEGDLSSIHNYKSSDLTKKDNYEFLLNLFKEVGLTKKAKNIEDILT